MSEESQSATHYRMNCPHCHKVVRVRLECAGKTGLCPHCMASVDFSAPSPAPLPVPMPSSPTLVSATTQQLLKLISVDDAADFDDARIDRVALLLSQATCRDFELAGGLLKGRPLSPRQWRRALNAADLRESMRLHIEERMGNDAASEPSAEEPAALSVATDTGAPDAWKVLARFLYYLRHGACEACKSNPTGLDCIYLTFDAFAAARGISTSRSENWRRLMHRQLGL